MWWQKHKQAISPSPVRLPGIENWSERGQFLFETLTPNLQKVYKRLGRIVNGHAPILLVGESGSGKNTLALALHHARRTRPQALLALHCADVSAEQFAQTFTRIVQEASWTTHANGHVSAAPQKTLEVTVLLQHVDELDWDTQHAVLRLLQESALRSSASPALALRLIATTNVALASLVTQKKFRQDFYYRLSTYEFELPPLRERLEDLPALLACYNAKHAGRLQFSADALEQLRAQRWPGNLRELHATYTRAQEAHLGRGNLIERFEFSPSDASAPLTARPNGVAHGAFAPKNVFEISSA